MTLSAPIPILRSFDQQQTRSFYVDYLGFSVDWEHRFDRDAPLYTQVSRGKAVLHLSEHHGDGTPGSAIRMFVDDIDGLLAELKSRPHPRLRPGIDLKPWGLRELTLTDPSSNRIIFVQPAAPGDNSGANRECSASNA